EARKAAAAFIGAAPQEIVFTRGCTESINLIAKSWGSANLRNNDVVALSLLEHHSNIVPWQQLSSEVKWIGIDDAGHVNMEGLDAILKEGNVKLISITGLSNVLGTMTPLQEIIQKAHNAGALVSVDAAQLIVHKKIDVKELDCDFFSFSGHKLYGPTGIGVLYAKQELLEAMPPFLGGGSMIGEVTTEGFTCADIPQKFEAGTPPITEAVGLCAAIDWLSQFDWTDIAKHEQALMTYAIEQLKSIEGLHLLSQLPIGCLSFTIPGIHPHDLTDMIGQKNICLRAGHHCTMPLHKHLGISASTRMSFAIYNTKDDIDRCIVAMNDAINTLTL
ncbi:MAG: cysteine desulfurase, partial [Candidatus Peregrinibacteria bacterium]|nr:cysteine desulfurase [Candidatus Peregrinibacteria bacterium]